MRFNWAWLQKQAVKEIVGVLWEANRADRGVEYKTIQTILLMMSRKAVELFVCDQIG